MISGIVNIERRVDTVTSFETYAASQSYLSANIVALDAAGADAIISITTLFFTFRVSHTTLFAALSERQEIAATRL